MPINGWSIKLFWGLSFGILSLKCQLCHLHCREEVVLVLKKRVLFEGRFFSKRWCLIVINFAVGCLRLKLNSLKKLAFTQLSLR